MKKTKRNFFILIFVVLFLSVVCLPALTCPVKALAASRFPGSFQYAIKSGDCLYNIAVRYSTLVDALKIVNGLKSDMIIAGDVLNIPANTSVYFSQYTIVSGDTLYSLARRHGISVGSLMSANELVSALIIPGDVLTVPLVLQKPLWSIIEQKGGINANSKLDIFIDKSEHALLLFSRGVWLKTYHVELGSGGMGDKEIQGDKKTPEGTFYIAEKSVISPVSPDIGSRWSRLSYPTSEDAARGLQKGLIDWNTYNTIIAANNNGTIPPQNTALGAGIGIHGGSSPAFGVNWTWGCIGLYNRDVEDFYDYIGAGTRVVIQK